MKCKYCDAELEEGKNICPVCGADNSVIPEQPEQNPAMDEPAAEAASVDPQTTVENMTEECDQPEKDPAQKSDSTGKLSAGNMVLLVILAIAAVAVIAALIVGGLKSGSDQTVTSETAGAESGTVAETTEPTIPEDGNPDDVTCKGTYTVSDEEMIAQRENVIASLGDAELTNSELQVVYWMQFYEFMENFGNYAAMVGFNMDVPLDMQKSVEGDTTWQQFFLQAGLDAWQNYKALSMKADSENFTMDPAITERLESLPDALQQTAEQAGFESVDAMIQNDMGVGATIDQYMDYMSDYYKGYQYYGSLMEKIHVTDADAEAYFDANAEKYAEKGLEKNDEKLVDARHILIQPEGGTTDEAGTVTYSDEEWEACKAAAQAVLDEYLSGDMTEERFAEFAVSHSDDPGSAAQGGLYAGIRKGQMVPPFEEWCFDNSRVAGDYGLVKTDFGYHVMYFVNSTPLWMSTAKQDLMAEKGNEILESVVAEYPFKADYSAIVLGLTGKDKE